MTVSDDAFVLSVATGISALVSAFIGALAAFSLQARADDKRARDAQLGALRSALFALSVQRSWLLNVGRQVLDPHRANPARAFMILPYTTEPTTVKIDLQSLLFLLADDDPGLLSEVQLCDERYRLCQTLIASRSDAHSFMQKRLADATTASGKVDLVVLRELVGRDTAARLEHLTDQLYEMREKALTSSRLVYSKLDAATRRLFPKAHLFRAEEPEEGDREIRPAT